MKKFWIITLFAICIFNGPGHSLSVSQAVETATRQKQLNGDFKTAQAIYILVHEARTQYSKMVVQKLEKDGTGASIDHLTKKGYVPLPNQFVRHVAEAFSNQTSNKGENKVFEYFLRSRWNLNPGQGIRDDFEKAGWEYLVFQQKEAEKAGIKYKDIKWKPFQRVEEVSGEKVLRFFGADPASAMACVTCHNAWERKPEIISLREREGIESKKVFKMHELMGAISINVFIDK